MSCRAGRCGHWCSHRATDSRFPGISPGAGDIWWSCREAQFLQHQLRTQLPEFKSQRVPLPAWSPGASTFASPSSPGKWKQSQ